MAAKHPQRMLPVPDLLTRQAELRPAAAAVVCGAETLTYGELERRSNRLAHLLLGRGVGPEVQVALALERGIERVVALAAVAKAGGAYVPLDADYPPERLRGMVADTGAALLVAGRAEAGRLPVLPAPLLVPAEEAARLAELADSPPPPALSAEARLDTLAYVNFTSGSTGRPKGVAVRHRGVARLVAELSAPDDYVRLGPGDVVLHFAPLAFDAATFEIWGALANGATLDVMPPGRPSLDALADHVAGRGITALWLTAGLFHQLVDARPDALAGVRQLLAGGDVLSVPHVRRALAAAGGVVVNGYGPTECTTFTTCWRMGAGEAPEPAGTVPIGRPIRRTRVSLLSPGREPMRGEAEGQLAVGGDGVARGYLGRPAATAAAFVPDPEGDGARLYLTGDLARRRGDGVYEFLGRLDDQVKVRGFRVEPGEIESALAEHPAVRGAAVLAEPDPAGGKRLVAFAATEAAPEELRRHLAQRLPEPMVPAHFEIVAELPLDRNGKVDRAALRELRRGGARPDLSTPYAAPRSAREAQVAALWAQMLGIDRVGVDDDLFELGGHSLLATRILARLRQDLGVEVPLETIFGEPTVAALAARLDRAAAAGGGALGPVERGPRRHAGGGPAPLAFPQRRVWFLQKLEPESLAYTFQAELRWRGRFEAAAFHRAVQALVDRHEVLRTAFAERGGEPVQLVRPPLPVRLPRVDLAALPAPRRDAERSRAERAVYMRPFDLEAPPLIGWTVFRLGPDDHAVLHREHHLIHDGWGFNVLLEELAELYSAAVAGRPPALPELPIQFADFARWQEEVEAAGEVDRQLEHWRRRLAGSPPLLELPWDRPRPPAQSFRGTSFRAELPAPLAAALRELSRRAGATLYQTLAAAFLALLHRYTGQSDLLLGAGVANRRFAATERLLGMLVNTVVLRTDVSGDPPFAALLERVRGITREAWAHQDVPLDRVVEAVRPGRDASYNPLFQVGFHFHDSPLGDVELPAAELTVTLGLPNGSAKFDLSVICILPREQKGARGGGREEVELLWEYSTDLFDEATMRRMLDHYRRLLEGVVAAPATPLSRLPLLGEDERRRLLVDFNRTASGYPRQATLADLFAEQAAAAPEAEALVAGDGRGAGERLTYRQLDARAEALAGRLAALGVGPGERVALALERSLEAVVAILAVVKAGGAYVPLDPEYPAERLAFMLADTAPAVLLTRAGLAASLPPHAARVVLVDGEPPGEAAAASAGPRRRPSADDLAYVMYTSGSTGRPKGVAVPHRAVARLVKDADFARLDRGETLLQLASLSFDASTLEIWGALANGGRLAVPPAGVLSLADLAAAVRGHGVTTLWLTAGLFHQVVDEDLAALSGVRQLLAGGDVLSPSHVRRALAELPGVRVINGYGPTENTTFTCCHPMDDPSAVGATVSIGRPIADSRVYVLDRGLDPVPPGVAGELCAAGDGLARGYFGRPAATAAAFVPDPFTAAPGERMYRTGDLVRWRPEGRLDFLGRRDGQVKLRGFRVEIGEVEAALAEHPAVGEAAVVVRGDGADRQLAAFVVPAADGAGGAADLAGELRRWLRGRLPEYMVPAAIVAAGALPLDPNGKVDRRELARRPLDEELAAAAGDGFVAPRNEVEELLAGIWSDLIGTPRIGVHDDFFALGGHSLHATRHMHRVREALGVELPVRALYEAPTIAALAVRVEERLVAELEALSDEEVERLVE